MQHDTTDRDTDRAATQTLDELTHTLAAADTALDAADTALTTAQHAYARATARGGYRTDAGHTASIAEYLPALEDAEAGARLVAERAERAARAAMDATERDYPTLTDAEAAAASSRAPFVKEDCADLPYPELLARIRHAVLTNDRAAMYCYQRYGTMRTARGDDDHPLDMREGEAKTAVAAACREIEARLRPQTARTAHARALTTLTRAHTLERRATARRRDADLAAQSTRTVPWPEEAS